MSLLPSLQGAGLAAPTRHGTAIHSGRVQSNRHVQLRRGRVRLQTQREFRVSCVGNTRANHTCNKVAGRAMEFTQNEQLVLLLGLTFRAVSRGAVCDAGDGAADEPLRLHRAPPSVRRLHLHARQVSQAAMRAGPRKFRPDLCRYPVGTKKK